MIRVYVASSVLTRAAIDVMTIEELLVKENNDLQLSLAYYGTSESKRYEFSLLRVNVNHSVPNAEMLNILG